MEPQIGIRGREAPRPEKKSVQTFRFNGAPDWNPGKVIFFFQYIQYRMLGSFNGAPDWNPGKGSPIVSMRTTICERFQWSPRLESGEGRSGRQKEARHRAVSMEPQIGIRGREWLWRLGVGVLGVSMEPQIGIRGRHTSRRTKITRVPRFQWSPRLESGEGAQPVRTHAGGAVVSMEPQIGIRGRSTK